MPPFHSSHREDQPKPVSARRVAIAAKTLENADVAAVACREVGLPFFVACALLEKESGGRNVYGHDKGGVLSGFPGEPNADNFAAFLWEVQHGRTSNGVGPCQITWKGYWPVMAKQGLRPWVVEDNMRFGFGLLKSHYDAAGSWEGAGTAYNGSPQYGRELAGLVVKWRKRLA